MAIKTSHPHSWSIKRWPAHVYPNSPDKARYLVRANKDSLILEGALVRVGRELVIIGDRYVRWMQKKGSAVPGYECPANKGRDAA
ncbi:MAG: hypothetical protein IID60_09780 [Proteobacteria bacterium]|nr:hypothetical protein [Pseudomonadota bacterium]